MLFVGTSIIHPSTEGVFLLCNILDLLIYSTEYVFCIARDHKRMYTKVEYLSMRDLKKEHKKRDKV